MAEMITGQTLFKGNDRILLCKNPLTSAKMWVMGGPPLPLHCILDLGTDLDQLKEIMKVTGTPPPEFVQKLQSAEVSGSGWWLDLGLGAGLSPFFPHRPRTTWKASLS